MKPSTSDARPFQGLVGRPRPTGSPPGRSFPRMACRSLLLGALCALAACNPQRPEARPGGKPAQAAETSVTATPVSLEINGFNYTDLYIDSFEVNGQGGGNLSVSSATSGGGGGVCCVNWSPGSTLPVKLDIKWTRDRKRWCEAQALIHGPVPANPRHLGVHFFPDGRIEAEITENYPQLKLRLERAHPDQRKESGNTVPDEQTARCRDGY